MLIWLYRKPFILHTKSMSIDDEVAIIGTSNMDMRSFGLNLELPMLVRGGRLRRTAARGRVTVSGRLAPTHPDEWLKRPLRSTVLDNLARLTSALQ